MPALLLFGVGAAAGWMIRGGTEDVAGIVKWGVIGGGVYLAARHLKVL